MPSSTSTRVLLLPPLISWMLCSQELLVTSTPVIQGKKLRHRGLSSSPCVGSRGARKLCREALCKLAVLSPMPMTMGHPGPGSHSSLSGSRKNVSFAHIPRSPQGSREGAGSSVGAFLAMASYPLSVCLSNCGPQQADTQPQGQPNALESVFQSCFLGPCTHTEM